MTMYTNSRTLAWLAAIALGLTVLVGGITAATAAEPRPLGGGLNGQNNYILDRAFVDTMKTAGVFRALTADGDIDFTNSAPVDEHGWPTTDFAVYLAQSPPPLGTYRLSFVSGAQPEVRVMIHPGSVQNFSWDPSTGRGTADVVLTAPDAEHFALAFSGTGGGARDIRVIRPGYDPANPPTFTNEYLNLLRSLNPSVVRFMDWTQTNDNVVSTWSERTQPADARQTDVTLTRTVPARDGGTQEVSSDKGIAWEYAMELANTVGADAWINVPTL